MHVRQLVDLAAMAASHGPALMVGASRLSSASVTDFAAASTARHERWEQSLDRFQHAASITTRPAQAWALVRPVVEEILVAEILTRIWAGVLTGYDRRRGSTVAEPTARQVLVSHLEIRRRTLGLLVDEPAIDTESAVAINRLRRRCERWTDLLLGHLMATHDVVEFAFEPDRTREFADELRQRHGEPGCEAAWPLTLVSLRAAFQSGLADFAPNSELNAQLAESILTAFPPELFDSTGPFHSLWIVRLTNTASDAEGLVEELLHVGHAAAPAVPKSARRF